MHNDQKESSLSANLAGCFCLTLLMVPFGFVGLWAGAMVGQYMSPDDELLMGYIATNEEVYGALFGGFLGLLCGFFAFYFGKRLLKAAGIDWFI